jgi:hypothetical protein
VGCCTPPTALAPCGLAPNPPGASSKLRLGGSDSEGAGAFRPLNSRANHISALAPCGLAPNPPPGAPSKLRLGGSDSEGAGAFRPLNSRANHIPALAPCGLAPNPPGAPSKLRLGGSDSEGAGAFRPLNSRANHIPALAPCGLAPEYPRHCLRIIPAQSTHTLVIASLPAINVTTVSTASPIANCRSKLRVMATRASSSIAPSATTGPNSAIQR